MEEIDWSRAPDGATHWDPVDRNHLQQLANVSLVWNIAMGWVSHQDQYPNDLSLCDRLVKRPPQEPKMAWSGAGLPPVGAVCVLSGQTACFKPIHPEWAGREVKIYAHFTADNGAELAAYVSPDHMIGGVGVDKLFLPLRTPEQIAYEEREKAIVEMLSGIDTSKPWSCAELAGLIHDKGYRLPEGAAQ